LRIVQYSLEKVVAIQLSWKVGRKDRLFEFYLLLCLPASYTKFRKILENIIFKGQIMHVNYKLEELKIFQITERRKVAQIDKIKSSKVKKYQGSGLLEPPYFNRFRGNIDIDIQISGFLQAPDLVNIEILIFYPKLSQPYDRARSCDTCEPMF
jgi:hypothetical protein